MSTDPSHRLSRRPLGLLGAAGAVLATIGAAAPAAAQSIDDLLTRKKLLVGILVDLPPFGLATGNNQYEGYDPDVARLMAKYLGVELELVPVAGPNRIPFLLANKVDMLIATFGITPERARQVAFSIAYSSLDIELLAPRATKISSMDDLKGLKVGVPRASGQDAVLSASAPAGTRIMRFEDDATNAQAMLSGQVDAIGAGIHIAKQIMKMNPAANYESKLLLRHQPNGIALRRGQADLLQWVNTFIYFVKNNGELDALYRKWLDGPMPELPVF
jgi:polar amino acid transport system substrate-binding protein